MHICFKIIKFDYTLRCCTCIGHCCVHHQEPSTTAHAASGYRVVLCWFRPPALFCCYCYMCSGGRLLMMDTVVSETCRAT
jgi:hypothetical protein